MLKREKIDPPKFGKAKKPKRYPIKYVLLSDIFFYLEYYNYKFNLYSRDQLLNRNYSIFNFDLLMFNSIQQVNISELIRKLIHRYRSIRSVIIRTIAILRYLKIYFKDKFVYIWLDCTGA